MKIGLIREGKIPPDARVALTPIQCARLREVWGLTIVVQTSKIRAYRDDEFRAADIEIVEDVSDCDLLLGIKEVPADQLVPNKIYCFFSHTIKEQPYNRKLLQAVLEKKIHLIDYEVLTEESGKRLIAFGYFAGMVGAHNGMWTFGQRTNRFHLPRLRYFRDYKEAKDWYKEMKIPPMRIVLTGTGRVARGARQVLIDMGIRQISPESYLAGYFPQEPVFTQLESSDYVRHKEGKAFEKAEYYEFPERFESSFEPYLSKTDLFINGIFWHKKAPAFFTVADMQKPSFSIQVIADVTCDIAPESSIPSTLKASTIAEPAFGFDPATGLEAPPFQSNCVDMMTIDNLPSELPRDASEYFGNQFIQYVLPELLNMEKSKVIERATIAVNGTLGPHYEYLTNYVSSK